MARRNGLKANYGNAKPEDVGVALLTHRPDSDGTRPAPFDTLPKGNEDRRIPHLPASRGVIRRADGPGRVARPCLTLF